MHRLPDGEVALKLNVLVRSRGVPERGDQDDPYAGTAPKPNTYAERWIRTLRVDYLDRIRILGRRQPEHALRIYCRHHNEQRPHRALRLQRPDGRDPTPLNAPYRLHRRDLLGGLIPNTKPLREFANRYARAGGSGAGARTRTSLRRARPARLRFRPCARRAAPRGLGAPAEAPRGPRTP
jgi:Integrase core domain